MLDDTVAEFDETFTLTLSNASGATLADASATAWGMQDNAFLRNGSSIHERNTAGYRTSYVHHIENPVRFEHEILVTIEHGHANHLANEMSSVAYWYADEPSPVHPCPPVEARAAVPRDNVTGAWQTDASPTRELRLTNEMRGMKREWAERTKP